MEEMVSVPKNEYDDLIQSKRELEARLRVEEVKRSIKEDSFTVL